MESHRVLEWSGAVEFKVGGRVARVLVNERSEAKVGDVSVLPEPGELTAQRLGAQAALSRAEAAIEQ